MDRRSWPWKKKASDKLVSAMENGNTPETDLVNEDQETRDPISLVSKVKDLTEKLTARTAESIAKDELVDQHAKLADDAVNGWEKAEAEAASLKQELEALIQQKVATEDRVSQLEEALKECVRQLRTVREEQEETIHDAVKKKSRELDSVRIELEEKLLDTKSMFSKVMEENASLLKSLQQAKRCIEEVQEGKSLAETEVIRLEGRLASLEKENSSARHEICLLEKELEIRSDEKEFTKRCAEAVSRQQLESVKKIAKLESDCQKLRIMIRKKLPGPAAIAQMKREAEKVGNVWRRPKSHESNNAYSLGLRNHQSLHESSHEANIQQIKHLSDRVFNMEADNDFLRKELENNKCNVTQSLSKQGESQRDFVYKRQGIGRLSGIPSDNNTDFSKASSTNYEPSHASFSEDVGNEDEASCAGSWASALISELEHFSKEKPTRHSNKSINSHELYLMDDFLEMERLATTSSEMLETERVSMNVAQNGEFETFTKNKSSEMIDGSLEIKSPQKMQEMLHLDGEDSKKVSSEGFEISLFQTSQLSHQELLSLILDAHSKGQNTNEVIKKVKAIISGNSDSPTYKINKIKERLSSLKILNSNSGSFDGVISEQFSPTSVSDGNSSENEIDPFLVSDRSKKDSKYSGLAPAVQKVMRLFEGIFQSSSLDNPHSHDMSQSASDSVPGYTMRILQWQNSELEPIVQKAVKVCNNFLEERARIEEFVDEVGIVLEWLANHFFSLKDVSAMRDTIKSQLEWDVESHSDTESPVLQDPEIGEGIKPRNCEKWLENNTTVTTSDVGIQKDYVCSFSLDEEAQEKLAEKNKLLGTRNEEIDSLKHALDVIKSEKDDLQRVLKATRKNLDELTSQLAESEGRNAVLQTELDSANNLKVSLENKWENQMLMSEEIEFQLKSATAELLQSKEKFASLQAELEEKRNCFQELEATCLDLQLQIESDAYRNEQHVVDSTISEPADSPVRKELDIATARKEYVKCVKKVNDIGKQINALENDPNQTLRQSSSLQVINQIKPDDVSLKETQNVTEECELNASESPKTKEVLWPQSESTEHSESGANVSKSTKSGLLYGWQLSSDSPIRDANMNEEKYKDVPPAASPLNNICTDNISQEREDIKSSTVQTAVPQKQKKHSRGGSLTRFLRFSRKGR